MIPCILGRPAHVSFAGQGLQLGQLASEAPDLPLGNCPASPYHGGIVILSDHL